MNNMIGERLKKARLDAKLTQETLGMMVGVSSSAISQYENEERSPSLDVFLRIIDILHVTPEYVLGRDLSVTSDNSDYVIHLAKEDSKIINEIKKYNSLYRKLVMETEKVVSAWNKRIGKS